MKPCRAQGVKNKIQKSKRNQTYDTTSLYLLCKDPRADQNTKTSHDKETELLLAPPRGVSSVDRELGQNHSHVEAGLQSTPELDAASATCSYSKEGNSGEIKGCHWWNHAITQMSHMQIHDMIITVNPIPVLSLLNAPVI